MKKVKIGVMGVYRGSSMIKYCKIAENAEIVAICDKWEEGIEKHKELMPDLNITYYNNFDEFIEHDMDAVVLANYAHEHAPFAIKAMRAGKHVFSEVLPCQNMQEAVGLVETVEETGKIYAYGENYCYMPAPYEMRRLYKSGKLGEFEYGEGEYIHNCDSVWHAISYGDPEHWRNKYMYATFYCTHSLGPIIHMTGLRPVSVTGFESLRNERTRNNGKLGATMGMELVTLENGGIVKSIHGGLYNDSVWYTLYGSKGHAESIREEASPEEFVRRVYTSIDKKVGTFDFDRKNYIPRDEMSDLASQFGHLGSDFYTMYCFVEKIRGNDDADIIDVYEALDMFLPGLFAYRSILNGGIPMEVPNLRNKSERDKWRNDTLCTDPKVAGEMLVPCYSKGNPDIPQEVYDRMRKKWEDELVSDEGYTNNEIKQDEINAGIGPKVK